MRRRLDVPPAASSVQIRPRRATRLLIRIRPRARGPAMHPVRERQGCRHRTSPDHSLTGGSPYRRAQLGGAPTEWPTAVGKECSGVGDVSVTDRRRRTSGRPCAPCSTSAAVRGQRRRRRRVGWSSRRGSSPGRSSDEAGEAEALYRLAGLPTPPGRPTTRSRHRARGARAGPQVRRHRRRGVGAEPGRHRPLQRRQLQRGAGRARCRRSSCTAPPTTASTRATCSTPSP